MKIAIGADHRGFAAKDKLKALLQSKGYEVIDFGTDSPKSFDYPDAAYPTCDAIISGEAECGVLLCGTGIGMSITANKVPGIRAALCHDELTADLARRHNDANVLCLPADLIGEELTRRIVEVYLTAEFEGGRHARRVKKIARREKTQRSSKKPSPADK